MIRHECGPVDSSNLLRNNFGTPTQTDEMSGHWDIFVLIADHKVWPATGSSSSESRHGIRNVTDMGFMYIPSDGLSTIPAARTSVEGVDIIFGISRLTPGLFRRAADERTGAPCSKPVQERQNDFDQRGHATRSETAGRGCAGGGMSGLNKIKRGATR